MSANWFVENGVICRKQKNQHLITWTKMMDNVWRWCNLVKISDIHAEHKFEEIVCAVLLNEVQSLPHPMRIQIVADLKQFCQDNELQHLFY
jgi:hypothetical protein